MWLAFLNLGASEWALLAVLLLVLFGADKAPQLARSLGQARAELDKAKGQVQDALRTDGERAWAEQVAFERERERKIAEAEREADPERAALARAASELGLQTQGLATPELKAAIAARLGAGAGPESDAKNAADAQQ